MTWVYITVIGDNTEQKKKKSSTKRFKQQDLKQIFPKQKPRSKIGMKAVMAINSIIMVVQSKHS